MVWICCARMWSLTCVPSGGVLEVFETEAHRSDLPRSRPADCGLLRATLRNQHIASVIVFTESGQIQFSAAVDTGAKPNDCDQARADDVPIPRASASGVHVRAVPGYKPGTNRITHHPTSTSINKRLYRWMAVSATNRGRNGTKNPLKLASSQLADHRNASNRITYFIT